MPDRTAVCLSADRRMLYPAFFVACSVISAAESGEREFDVVIVVPAGCLTAEDNAFAKARGIILDDSLDIDVVEGMNVQQERLSIAALVKPLLPRHFMSRYRRLIYIV